jgi:hypothetical protein
VFGGDTNGDAVFRLTSDALWPCIQLGPRRPGGQPQRQSVVAADEIARRRARVIAAARGEVGELSW